VEDPVLGISLPRLAIAFLPALVVLVIIFRWSSGEKTAIHALARMVLQLVMIGYLLTFIFETNHSMVVIGILTVMLLVACWISLRPLREKNPRLYGDAFIAILVGGVPTLFLVTGLVLRLDPWFLPRYMIPLAGMIFSGAMNSVSLAAERFESECRTGKTTQEAERVAFQAALIPIINSLFAVGIVALPGMMTGQILAGSSPLVAARYQMVVMCMLFGASGVAAAVYLALVRSRMAGRMADRVAAATGS
jgi:putative ABC transport system permease protein